jgi:arsenical pump membrane protein
VTGTSRVVVTLLVFTSMLALVVVRPRRTNEAWWTMLAAGVMLALGLVSPRDALDAAVSGKAALLFLLSLLALALLVEKSGFFEWAAIRCARFAKGDAHALYRNSFVLGALVTAALSLDTTAVILTPIVLALVRRLKLPAVPYVALCALVANVGSLLLPISNLTNILFAETFHLTFGGFAARMVAPQLVALVTAYALLRWQFRRELPARFDGDSLGAPEHVVPSRPYFVACVVVLVAVLVGYFLAPLLGVAPYVVAFAGVGILSIAGAVTERVRPRAIGELAWGVFPFVVGLFVAVRGLENLGLVGASASCLAQMTAGSPAELLATAGATAMASNAMNNLPAALIVRSVLQASHAHHGAALAALVGADVGPIVAPFASLATMLVIARARSEGVEVRVGRLVAFGAWAAPILVVVTTVALVATTAISAQ